METTGSNLPTVPSSEIGRDALGYFKYEGPLVAEGYFDAKKSADALLGINEVIRYFLIKEDKALAEVEFDIPVRVTRGSWVADVLLASLGTGAIAVVGKYAYTAAEEMAKHDFKNKGVKDIGREAFKAIKWVIKIAKHLGSMKQVGFFNGSLKQEGADVAIEISDNAGNKLLVPEKYLRMFRECPPQLFELLAKHIQAGRELEIGTSEKLDDKDVAKSVEIKVGQKYIFARPEEEEEEMLFPELVHGMHVQLPGRLTKGNEKENTLGLEYNGHILICRPLEGKITRYGRLLFSNCMVEGIVDRKGSHGSELARRPSVKFSSIISLDNQPQQDLFS